MNFLIFDRIIDKKIQKNILELFSKIRKFPSSETEKFDILIRELCLSLFITSLVNFFNYILIINLANISLKTNGYVQVGMFISTVIPFMLSIIFFFLYKTNENFSELACLISEKKYYGRTFSSKLAISIVLFYFCVASLFSEYLVFYGFVIGIIVIRTNSTPSGIVNISTLYTLIHDSVTAVITCIISIMLIFMFLTHNREIQKKYIYRKTVYKKSINIQLFLVFVYMYIIFLMGSFEKYFLISTISLVICFLLDPVYFPLIRSEDKTLFSVIYERILNLYSTIDKSKINLKQRLKNDIPMYIIFEQPNLIHTLSDREIYYMYHTFEKVKEEISIN